MSLKLSDFDFELPEELIALRPAVPRSSARLLLAEGERQADRQVSELADILRPGDRLVLNNTRVIPARLFGTRTRQSAQGRVEARIEVTLCEPRASMVWAALIKPLRKLKDGETIAFGPDLNARLIGREAGFGLVEFNLSGDDFDAAIAAAGAMPLPPYIAAKRPADEQDREDYQTVWAARDGAVAAPTASLHFDSELLSALVARGVEMTYVTLHVGAGTFLPIKVDDISDHKMHAEWGEVTPEAAAQIRATRAGGGRVIAVGTTSLRLIETAARSGEIAPFIGPTDIFIRPGFEFYCTDGLMTNFHLPRSTLLMLVSALMGLDRMRGLYRHAIRENYRFFSYGDASLLLPSAK